MNPMTYVLVMAEDTATVGGQPCEDGVTEWSEAAISQETPRITGSHQSWEEPMKDSSLKCSGRTLKPKTVTITTRLKYTK